MRIINITYMISIHNNIYISRVRMFMTCIFFLLIVHTAHCKSNYKSIRTLKEQSDMVWTCLNIPKEDVILACVVYDLQNVQHNKTVLHGIEPLRLL